MWFMFHRNWNLNRSYDFTCKDDEPDHSLGSHKVVKQWVYSCRVPTAECMFEVLRKLFD